MDRRKLTDKIINNSPLQTIEEIIQYRKSFWESQWAQKDFKPIWADRDCPIEIQNAFKDKKISPKDKVLDVGCGLGEIAHWFSLNNFQVDAFDISQSAIDKAKKKFSNEKINFFTHDLCDAKLKNKYDIIVDRGCFHQIPTKLKEAFCENLIASANDHCQFFLFVKAFRGDIKLSKQDEAKFHITHVKKYYSNHFNLLQCKLTNLSPDDSVNKMPGLYFYLTKK